MTSSVYPIRHIEPEDYPYIISVVDPWWGGRAVAGLLPRLFFEHFRPLSFAIGEHTAVEAFLVGFRSQTLPDLAYIHFVGVAPDRRSQGYGRALYVHFFSSARQCGCQAVRCITSPGNHASIAFHRAMGFEILAGDGMEQGVTVQRDYAGVGQHRVLFHKSLL
jgi:GNAT superfamily N-acetyltransferase